MRFCEDEATMFPCDTLRTGTRPCDFFTVSNVVTNSPPFSAHRSSEKNSTWSITSRLKKEKIDVIVATSTRLIDFIKSKSLSLDAITIFILDEVDRLTNKQFRGSVHAVEGLINKEAVRVGGTEF